MRSSIVEQEQINHIILTRYNVPIKGLSRNNLDISWLESRRQLFFRYCVPSILDQTCQDFVWLILFDAATPKSELQHISDALPSNARIALTSDPVSPRSLREMLGKAGVTARRPLLTTRLDNDDAIAQSFVERVQDAARRCKATSATALNMPFGFQVWAGRLYLLFDSNNAFLSLLEPGDEYQTVLGTAHRQITDVAHLRQAWGGPKWLQVVHTDNVDNPVRGIRIPRAPFRACFGLRVHLDNIETHAPATALRLTINRVMADAQRILARVSKRRNRKQHI